MSWVFLVMDMISGHPVACAVAVKTLEIYERDDMLGHVNKVSPIFIERLKKCDQYDLDW